MREMLVTLAQLVRLTETNVQVMGCRGWMHVAMRFGSMTMLYCRDVDKMIAPFCTSSPCPWRVFVYVELLYGTRTAICLLSECRIFIAYRMIREFGMKCCDPD